VSCITFTIPGEPIAKGRPRATTIHGSARLYTPKKTESYEGKAGVYAVQAMAGRPPLQGPVALSFTAVFGIPKSWSGRRKTANNVMAEYVTKKPDVDNLAKIIGDALNGITWIDDSQVVELRRCVKVYGDVPGVEVSIESLGVPAC
jgi:Holliday junction resolvase RusA-like endonuclease